MKIFAPFAAVGLSLMAAPALAQGPAGPGARVDNSVGNWGQPPSGGTIPCLVAPAPSGSSNCGLPVIILGGGSGGGSVTLAAGSVAAGAYVSGSVLSGAFAAGAISDLGTGASPAANTTNNYLQTVSTAQGAQGTGYNPPSGGSGILGYLSGIFKAITGTLTTQGAHTSGGSGVAFPTDAVNVNGALYATNGTTLDSINSILNGSAHALQVDESTSSQFHIDLTSPIPAGSAIIGQTGIDQTTDGTTNAVHLKAGTALAGKFGIDQTTPGTTNQAATVATSAAGAPNYIVQTTGSVAISVASATTTQLVAASGSLVIYVTHFDFMAAAADNVTLESADTGGSCANPVALTGAYNAAANGGISAGGGLGPILVLPAGKALCVLTTTSAQLSGSLAKAQF